MSVVRYPTVVNATDVLKHLYPDTNCGRNVVYAINRSAGTITFAPDPSVEIGEIYELYGQLLLVVDRTAGRVDDFDSRGYWVSWTPDAMPLVIDMEEGTGRTFNVSDEALTQRGRRIA